MKAMVVTHYGPPEVLEIQEVEKPSPANDEILIKVHATTVGPTDWHFRLGSPFLARILAGGLRKPKVNILGFDVSGSIAEIGSNVDQFETGDEVYGLAAFGKNGANAEYICVPATNVSMKPTSMTHEEAAGIPSGAGVSLIFLRSAGIRAGQHVLINGASGGLGIFGVQLAKHFGAEVTGVCSTGNIEMVRSLGADHVIDYNKQDFTKDEPTYDLIYDAVGKRSYKECQAVLKPKGTYITTWASINIFLNSMWTLMYGSKRAKYTMPKIGPEEIRYFDGLVQAGKLKTIVDRVYPLEELRAAHEYSEAGHAKGRIIIRVTGNE